MVEHDLAKVGVASSSLVSRSKYEKAPLIEWRFFLRVFYGWHCLVLRVYTCFIPTPDASHRAFCISDRFESWFAGWRSIARVADGLFRGFALATIVTVIVLVTVPHGPILVALPITMALSFSASLLSTPLISAPVVSAPIVSTIVPTVVMPVSVVMGKQRPLLRAGHTGQGRPRVAGGLGRSLNGWDFSCGSRG